MSPRLVSLRSAGPDKCVAEFVGIGDVPLIVEFTVMRKDGIVTASSSPDVFRDFNGSAEEQRRLVAAVAAFCEVASSDA